LENDLENQLEIKETIALNTYFAIFGFLIRNIDIH